jgi:acetyltransferase
LALDFSDFIDYYCNDKNTEVITIYVESLKKGMGGKFIETCKRCNKPIVALKSGKTEMGEKAASSHTAALASAEGVYEGIFKQCGIIEVDSIKQLFKTAEILTKVKKIGKRACIVTNAGGLGVLTTDYCVKNNIELPNLPDNVKNKLDKILPLGWSKNNPVDILGDAKPERYIDTFKILEKEKFFDFFIVLLTPQYMTEAKKTAEVLLGIKDKPVIACFMGESKVEAARVMLKDKIPVFSELKEMSDVLGKVIN